MPPCACYDLTSTCVSVSIKRCRVELPCNHSWSRTFFQAVVTLALTSELRAAAASTFDSVYISEFLAQNACTLQDNTRSYSGYIELYNGGFEVVNLGGWFLSDTQSNLTKWAFPGVGILPGTYLLVFASGQDSKEDLAHLHTNFQLNKNGGYLALSDPATNVVSEFIAYPRQSADVSYG